MIENDPRETIKKLTSAERRLQVVLGAILALVTVAVCAFASWGAGVVSFGIGAVLLVLGLHLRRSEVAVPLVNRSLDLISRGRLGEAEELLGHVEATVRWGHVRRITDLHRATSALRRGALAPAIQHADAAIARPLGVLARGQDRMNLAGAHAMRAFIRALTDDAPGAREDAAVVRRSPYAAPDSLARAELAEAVVLERSGDREALRAHLVQARRLLLGYTVPRERAVVRAYQRMLETRRSSVYRESVPHAPERAAGGELTVADWIAVVAPAAAPFARSTRATGGGAAARLAPQAEPVDPRTREAAQARVEGKGPTGRIGRLALVYATLIAISLAIWQFLAPATPQPMRADEVEETPDAAAGGFPIASILASLALSGALVAAVRMHTHRQSERLVAALRAIACGDEEGGRAELHGLAKSRYPLIAGSAWLQLAALAERHGDFAGALDACDRGLLVVTKNYAARIAASAFMLPELVAERAFVLTATDRHAEASAEMALLAGTYPAYPFRARAELRTCLVRSVRRGDLEGAARLVADGIDDVPLTLHEEVLANLVRAAVHPELAEAGEIECLKQDMRLDARLRGWLEATAPAALAAFVASERVAEPPAP